MKRFLTRLSGALITVGGTVYMFTYSLFYELFIAYLIVIVGLATISIGENLYT